MLMIVLVTTIGRTAVRMGIPIGMGMGTVVNPDGPVGILWRFSNGCEIKWKHVKQAIMS